MAFDPVEKYEEKAESLSVRKDSNKVHLIVGVQKVRSPRNYTLKVEDTLAMKAEVGRVEIEVVHEKK